MTIRDESTLYGSHPCGEVSIIKSRSELFNSRFAGLLTGRKVRGPFDSRSNFRPFAMIHCTFVFHLGIRQPVFHLRECQTILIGLDMQLHRSSYHQGKYSD